MQDIRLEGKAGRLGSVMTAVVVDTPKSKDYRLPTEHELAVATPSEEQVQAAFKDVPFGVPDEPTPAGGGSGAGRAFSVQGYGLMQWRDLFTSRQLTALGSLIEATRAARKDMAKYEVTKEWIEAVGAYLACSVDRLVDFANVNTQWKLDADTLNHAMVRYAIQITWDFAEGNPIGFSAGAYQLCFNRIATGLDTLALLPTQMEPPTIIRASAQKFTGEFDLVLTDPPYYDAIPYSDLMDWFYIFLRRMVGDLTSEHKAAMEMALAPKWDNSTQDGELVDDCSRHDGNAQISKQAYEDGMAMVFGQCFNAIVDEGRLVIVFANKSPNAWETLVSAVIRAGFVVDGSWPIQTEQPSRTRGISSAALASSVWLVCKKRSTTAKPGWDNKVLEEMKTNIAEKLRAFWDAGIRGPDFVWAATGPAMEAYSKHPVVRKANAPGEVMGVSEFLNHVRRMVVDYVVGQVLSGDQGADMSSADRLDEVTAYYLLHRHDFGMDESPVGACILYATACGLSDSELDKTWDVLIHVGSDAAKAAEAEEAAESDDAEGDAEAGDDGGSGGGSKVKLKPWNQRKGKSMGHEAPEGKPVPLIDRIHRVMHLWKEGDKLKVDEFLDQHALRRNELFKRVVQSLIELSENNERATLESISNEIQAKGAVKDDKQQQIKFEVE